MKGDLERVELPEGDARERAWSVVRAAFETREPVPREPRRWPLAVVLAAAVLAAALVTPPGRAVLDEIREAVGVERAQPALFSLPTGGRLLVASDAGIWIVQDDGSRRLLGAYREASWSPFGRYVVAARENELAALEPDGTVRWTLARRDVRFPRWAGTQTDTRIAYLSGSRLHVVAGDGTRDVDVGGLPAAARVAPAWRPAKGFLLAYADTRGRVALYDTAAGALVWRSAPGEIPSSLEWSSDGLRLLVLRPYSLRVYDVRRRVLARDDLSDATVDADAAFRPGSHQVAVIRVHGEQSDVVALGSGRVLFRGTGVVGNLAWSGDGRWLLVGWPEADQWVFARADGRRIRAVSNVSAQLRSRSFPRVEGWCCARPA